MAFRKSSLYVPELDSIQEEEKIEVVVTTPDQMMGVIVDQPQSPEQSTFSKLVNTLFGKKQPAAQETSSSVTAIPSLTQRTTDQQ